MSDQRTAGKRAPFGIALLLISISACSSPAASSSAAATTAADTPVLSALVDAASTDPSLSSAIAPRLSRPEATEAQIQQISTKLATIQPEMAEIKISRVESWSKSMCQDIWTADPAIDLVDRAAQRFAGSDRPPLSDEQAQQVVDAIAETYCHS